jgi:hypothetical protein
MDEKSMWIPTCQHVDNVSWFVGLCDKAHLRADSNIPRQLESWYNLGMRVEGPHKCHMVMVLGSCVKWPLG